MGVLKNRTDNAEGILGIHYALDYGLVVDGITDGAGAIQRAINAAGGGQVVLPPSSQPVVIGSTLKLLDNTELVIPSGCTLQLLPGANCDMIANVDPVGGNSRIRIFGAGVIDGNRAGQTGASNGINLVKCDDARISVTVQNCYTDGLVLDTCNRPVLDVASSSNGRHGVYVTASVFPTGNLVVVNNGQRVSGNGLTFDAASTDASINLAATDTQGVKTQQYGVLEAAASNCDRNTILGSLNGNATGSYSLVGASSTASLLANPMTAAGDLITGGPSGSPARFAMGTAKQGLRVNAGGTALEFAKTLVTDLDPTGLTASQYLRVKSDGTVVESAAVVIVPTMISKAYADSPYTVPAWNYHVDVDASGGAVTVNLPTAVGNAGALIEVRKADSSTNTVTVVPNGTQTINGAASLVIYNQYDSYSLRSDGANVEVV